MEKIKFFQGIAPPRPKYPFAELKIGCGFFVEGGKMALISAHRSYYQKKLGDRKFSVKKVKGGVRVWRIK